MQSVVSMEVDEDGELGGASDHNLLITKFRDKFVYISKAPVLREAGWDIQEEQDWSKYREVVAKELRKERGQGVEGLAHSITQAVLKGLEEGVGRRKSSSSSSGVQRFPKFIVKILKERKCLEREWKRGKTAFARSGGGGSGVQGPGSSLVVAKQKLKEKTEELEKAKAKFYRQKRKPLLKLARVNKRKARKVFWSHVSRKQPKSGEIQCLKDRETGVLRYDAEGMCDQAYEYFVDIFSGARTKDQMRPGGDQEEGSMGGQEVEQGGVGVCQEGEAEQWMEEVEVLEMPGTQTEEGGVNKFMEEVQVREGEKVPEDGAGGDEPQDKILRSVDQSRRAGSDPAGFLDRDFSPGEMRKVLEDMGDTKAPGWDSIPNEALKQGPPELMESLVILFNRVKDQGVTPEAWKRGRITLVHKKGPLSDVYNYRPITVLTSVSSLYTKLLNHRLTEVTEEHGLLGQIQHGFRKGRSGADACFVLNTVLSKSAAKRRKVHMSFLDVAKAYDTVCRRTLWARLAARGFGGRFLASIQSLYRCHLVTCLMTPVICSPGHLIACSPVPLTHNHLITCSADS